MGKLLYRYIDEDEAKSRIARAVAEERERVRSVLDGMLQVHLCRLEERYCCLSWSAAEALRVALRAINEV